MEASRNNVHQPVLPEYPLLLDPHQVGVITQHQITSIRQTTSYVASGAFFHHSFTDVPTLVFDFFSCAKTTHSSSVALWDSRAVLFLSIFLLYGSLFLLFNDFYHRIEVGDYAPHLAWFSLVLLYFHPLWASLFVFHNVLDWTTIVLPLSFLVVLDSVSHKRWGVLMLLSVLACVSALFIRVHIPFPSIPLPSILLSVFLPVFSFVPSRVWPWSPLLLSLWCWCCPSFSSFPPLSLIVSLLSLVVVAQSLRLPLSLVLVLLLSLLTNTQSFSALFVTCVLPPLTFYTCFLLLSHRSSHVKLAGAFLCVAFLFLYFCDLRILEAMASVALLPSGSLRSRFLEMRDVEETESLVRTKYASSRVCSLSWLMREGVRWDSEEDVYYALRGTTCEYVFIAPYRDGIVAGQACNKETYSFLCDLLSANGESVHFTKEYASPNQLYHLFRFVP